MNTIIKDIVISINSITLIYIMFQYKDTCMKKEKTIIIVELLWRDTFKMRTLERDIVNIRRLADFLCFPTLRSLPFHCQTPSLSEELPAHTAPSHPL